MIDARAFDSAQVVYNMLNPSAAVGLPVIYPAQDYGRLFDHTRVAGVGIVGIRVLAGGALSGSAERHPIASSAARTNRAASPGAAVRVLALGDAFEPEQAYCEDDGSLNPSTTSA